MKRNTKFSIVQAARILRKKMTPAEILLWKYLDNSGMCGIKFRRQYPFKGFIIDFYCPSNRLGIELDGGIHKKQKKEDMERQTIIESEGIEIIRFKNEAVLNSLDSVLKQIKRKVVPSPRSGEGCPDAVGAG